MEGKQQWQYALLATTRCCRHNVAVIFMSVLPWVGFIRDSRGENDKKMTIKRGCHHRGAPVEQKMPFHDEISPNI
jgi:hypothetical protein